MDDQDKAVLPAAQNLLAYVTWENIQLWKRETPTPHRDMNGEIKRPPPYAYGTAQPVFVKYAKEHSVIWIFTCPTYGEYTLAPSLVARLKVVEQVEYGSPRHHELGTRIPRWFPKGWTHIALADTTPGESDYFPLNNAFEQLTSLDFTNERLDERLRSGTSIRPRDRPSRISHSSSSHKPGEAYSEMPRRLRFVRRLFPGDERTLQVFADALRRHRKVFISYARREERQEHIGALIEALIHRQYAPWLDMKAIPDDVARGDRPVDTSVLEQMLRDGIRQSDLFVAIVGPQFRASAWCVKEWRTAQGEGIDWLPPRCALVSLDGGELNGEKCDGDRCGTFRFLEGETTASKIAEHIDGWFNGE